MAAALAVTGILGFGVISGLNVRMLQGAVEHMQAFDLTLPKPPPPDQPKPEPQWWEERARWRQRGPGDHDWNRPQPGRCLVDYDVLRVDNGYDPFAEFRKKDDT